MKQNNIPLDAESLKLIPPQLRKPNSNGSGGVALPPKTGATAPVTSTRVMAGAGAGSVDVGDV